MFHIQLRTDYEKKEGQITRDFCLIFVADSRQIAVFRSKPARKPPKPQIANSPMPKNKPKTHAFLQVKDIYDL